MACEPCTTPQAIHWFLRCGKNTATAHFRSPIPLHSPSKYLRFYLHGLCATGKNTTSRVARRSNPGRASPVVHSSCCSLGFVVHQSARPRGMYCGFACRPVHHQRGSLWAGTIAGLGLCAWAPSILGDERQSFHPQHCLWLSTKGEEHRQETLHAQILHRETSDRVCKNICI